MYSPGIHRSWLIDWRPELSHRHARYPTTGDTKSGMFIGLRVPRSVVQEWSLVSGRRLRSGPSLGVQEVRPGWFEVVPLSACSLLSIYLPLGYDRSGPQVCSPLPPLSCVLCIRLV